jgi:hypothetical protein
MVISRITPRYVVDSTSRHDTGFHGAWCLLLYLAIQEGVVVNGYFQQRLLWNNPNILLDTSSRE